MPFCVESLKVTKKWAYVKPEAAYFSGCGYNLGFIYFGGHEILGQLVACGQLVAGNWRLAAGRYYALLKTILL